MSGLADWSLSLENIIVENRGPGQILWTARKEEEQRGRGNDRISCEWQKQEGDISLPRFPTVVTVERIRQWSSLCTYMCHYNARLLIYPAPSNHHCYENLLQFYFCKNAPCYMLCPNCATSLFSFMRYCLRLRHESFSHLHFGLLKEGVTSTGWLWLRSPGTMQVHSDLVATP